MDCAEAVTGTSRFPIHLLKQHLVGCMLRMVPDLIYSVEHALLHTAASLRACSERLQEVLLQMMFACVLLQEQGLLHIQQDLGSAVLALQVECAAAFL